MKICFLLPAFNCAHTIAEVCARLPLRSWSDEILVIDDGSEDGTAEVARRLPRVRLRRHERNAGYGRTNADLYRFAVEREADIAVTLHADLGHRPEDASLLLDALTPDVDVVTGSRLLYLQGVVDRERWTAVLDTAKRRHMPLSRAVGHFVLTTFQNLCYGTDFRSFHDGMRACGRNAIAWAVTQTFSGWYLYDTDFLLAAHRHGLRIAELPVTPNYDSRSRSSAPRIKYGIRVARHAVAELIRRARH